MRLGGFGYEIDYSKAIAEDEAKIARLTDPRLLATAAEMLPGEDHVLSNGALDVFAFVVKSPERRARRAAIFGLSDADMFALALWLDLGEEIDPPAFAAASAFATTAAALDRGQALAYSLDDFHFLTEQERRDALRRARASLARHRRNSAVRG